jgi:DNA-binding transcriptional MerR regulator
MDEVKENLLSISNFSEITKIPISTLKYYDDIGLFCPYQREKNGYRFYSRNQTISVNFIRVLTQFGLSLKEIKDLMDIKTPQKMMKTLIAQEMKLDEKMRTLQESTSILHVYLSFLFAAQQADEHGITQETLAEVPLRLGKPNDFRNGSDLYNAFYRFLSSTSGLNPCFPIGGMFSNFQEFKVEPSKPTRFFSVDPLGEFVKPQGNYVVGYVRGFFAHAGDVVKRIMKYAEEHHLVLSGHVYTVFILNEVTAQNSEDYLMQVSVAVQDGT